MRRAILSLAVLCALAACSESGFLSCSEGDVAVVATLRPGTSKARADELLHAASGALGKKVGTEAVLGGDLRLRVYEDAPALAFARLLERLRAQPDFTSVKPYLLDRNCNFRGADD